MAASDILRTQEYELIALRSARTSAGLLAVLLPRLLLSSLIVLIGVHGKPVPNAWALGPLNGTTLIPDEEEAHEEEEDEALSEPEDAPEVAVPLMDVEPVLPSSATATTATVDVDTSLSENLLNLTEPVTSTTSTTTSLSGHLTTSTATTAAGSSTTLTQPVTSPISDTTTTSSHTDAAVAVNAAQLTEPSTVTQATETSPTITHQTDLNTTVTNTNATETAEISAPVPVSAQSHTTVATETETPVGTVAVTGEACISVNSPGCASSSPQTNATPTSSATLSEQLEQIMTSTNATATDTTTTDTAITGNAGTFVGGVTESSPTHVIESTTVADQVHATTTGTSTTAAQTVEVAAPVPVSSHTEASVGVEAETPVGSVGVQEAACVSVNSPGCGDSHVSHGTADEVLAPPITSGSAQSAAVTASSSGSVESASSAESTSGGASSPAATSSSGAPSNASVAEHRTHTGARHGPASATPRPSTSDQPHRLGTPHGATPWSGANAHRGGEHAPPQRGTADYRATPSPATAPQHGAPPPGAPRASHQAQHATTPPTVVNTPAGTLAHPRGQPADTRHVPGHVGQAGPHTTEGGPRRHANAGANGERAATPPGTVHAPTTHVPSGTNGPRPTAGGAAHQPASGAAKGAVQGTPMPMTKKNTSAATPVAQGASACPEGQVPGQQFHFLGLSVPANPGCVDARHGK